MSSIEKIADLKYCYHVLDGMKDLEKNLYQRDLLIEELHEKVAQDGNNYAFFAAWTMPILSLLVLGWLTFSHIGSMGPWSIIGRILATLSISCALYLLVYFGIKLSWEKGLLSKSKANSYLKWAKKLENKKILINRNFEEILNQDVLQNRRIALRYYSSLSFEQLIDYLETDQAYFLEEAVYLLDKNQKRHLSERKNALEDIKNQRGKEFLLESIKN